MKQIIETFKIIFDHKSWDTELLRFLFKVLAIAFIGTGIICHLAININMWFMLLMLPFSVFFIVYITVSADY